MLYDDAVDSIRNVSHVYRHMELFRSLRERCVAHTCEGIALFPLSLFLSLPPSFSLPLSPSLSLSVTFFISLSLSPSLFLSFSHLQKSLTTISLNSLNMWISSQELDTSLSAFCGFINAKLKHNIATICYSTCNTKCLY